MSLPLTNTLLDSRPPEDKVFRIGYVTATDIKGKKSWNEGSLETRKNGMRKLLNAIVGDTTQGPIGATVGNAEEDREWRYIKVIASNEDKLKRIMRNNDFAQPSREMVSQGCPYNFWLPGGANIPDTYLPFDGPRQSVNRLNQPDSAETRQNLIGQSQSRTSAYSDDHFFGGRMLPASTSQLKPSTGFTKGSKRLNLSNQTNLAETSPSPRKQSLSPARSIESYGSNLGGAAQGHPRQSISPARSTQSYGGDTILSHLNPLGTRAPSTRRSNTPENIVFPTQSGTGRPSSRQRSRERRERSTSSERSSSRTSTRQSSPSGARISQQLHPSRSVASFSQPLPHARSMQHLSTSLANSPSAQISSRNILRTNTENTTSRLTGPRPPSGQLGQLRWLNLE